MPDLTITLLQARQVWEDKPANLRHYESLLADCGPTDLILLPEMFHTGFSSAAERMADSFADSPGLDWLRTAAARANAAFYTSIMVRDDGRFYNRGVFVTPDGATQCYDKRMTFGLAGEDRIFTAGTRETIVMYRGWRVQLQICYDLRFPEISRNRIESDGQPAYDLLLYTANWPARRALHWRSLLPARAIENQCWVAAVNRVGEDGNGLSYSGDSMIVDAQGRVAAMAPPEEAIITHTISRTALDDVRTALPFLKDRQDHRRQHFH
ncbi:MAG TPA: amidohydrolase [Kiritimatiellia bacterium]|nr:amidohydrolase [Kiritimatiellia bacterium]